MSSLEEFRQRVEAEQIERLDLKVGDLFGRWHHFTLPIEAVTADLFRNGQGFDGSSLRGFQEIHESDLLLIPDLSTLARDPAFARPTLGIICDVIDPVSQQPYARDPRHVARCAEDFLRRSGVADASYWGPELEFFVFDEVRYQQAQHTGFYFVDSAEAAWNQGREEQANLGYKVPMREGYAPAPPFDALADLRGEMVAGLQQAGIPIFIDHHEVATAGQCEIGMAHGGLVQQADRVQWYKHVVRNVARQSGRVATFMPKPLFGDNGSGMHVHQSLWRGGQPLFHDSNGYAGLSQQARWYIGGLLRHAPAVMAFAAPSTNSYRRLVPGFEAPVYLMYSMRNRSAAIRIPTYSQSAESRRIEFRPPDGTANPYLAFSAMLLAGIDGIQRQIEPGDPADRNLYALGQEDAQRLPCLPASLDEALDALDADRAFLKQGNVFGDGLIDAWIEAKRRESYDLRLRPTPYEYELYFSG